MPFAGDTPVARDCSWVRLILTCDLCYVGGVEELLLGNGEK